MDFLVEFTTRNGYSPSFEEIASELNLASLATVHKHISSLEQKGYLRRRFNESRSIEVTEEYINAESERKSMLAPQDLTVPLRGRIAAGNPVEAIEQPEVLNLTELASTGETFALEVRGDSMIDDHICSGDYVLAERVSSVRDGDIVVALVDGMEATLKRLYREGEMIRLQPANASMEPIRVPAENVQIQGRVLAVLRKYR